MLRSACLAALVALAAAAHAAPPSPSPSPSPAEAIRAELMREAAAWSKGDLEGFLAGYEHAPTTLFVGRTQLYRGWDAIAAMYRAHYPGRARMGTLSFDHLEVHPLGDGYALAVGQFHLARAAADGGPASGWFTLTWHRGAAGWRILVDHTS